MPIASATMVEYWERLEPEMDAKKMDITALADALKISYQAVAKVRNGGSFGSANNIKAAKLFGLNPEWLATEKGPKYAGKREFSALPAPLIGERLQNLSFGPEIKGDLVPLISWVQAGTWKEASDPFQPGEAESWLACPKTHSSNTFALRVRGESMTAPHGNTRTYPAGCVIFVDPEQCMPKNGDRIIAKLLASEEVTFKVYKNEDGRQWLQPLNPTHDKLVEEFRVIGTVIGKWEDE